MNQSVLITLLAVLMILGTTAVPAAETQDTKTISVPLNVKFYGYMNVSVDEMDDGENSDLYLSSNSSNIGVMGHSALSGDTRFIWKLESYVNFDESGNALATKNCYVGVQGSAGKFYGGRHDTPFKNLVCKSDLFANRIGDIRNIAGVGGAGFNQRPNNILGYLSPSWKGMTASLAYVLEDGVDESNLTSSSLTFKSSNLRIGFAMEQHGRMWTAKANEQGAKVLSNTEESGLRFSGDYTIGQFKFIGLYEALSDVDGILGTDRQTYGGGIAYTFKNSTFKGQLYTTGGRSGVDDSGATMIVSGFDRHLSSNTLLYLAFAMTDNESAASLKVSGGGHGDKVEPKSDEPVTGLAIGLTHTF